MAAVEAEIHRTSVLDDIWALICFFVGGLISGLAFAWATSRPSLRQFWYIKGDKFLIPRYSYWAAFGIMLLVGLVIPYVIARSRRWVPENLGSPIALLVSILIIGVSAPALDLLTRKMLEHGLRWEPVTVLLVFLVLISLALSLATQRLRFLPLVFVWNAVFGGAAFFLISAAVRLTAPTNDWYDFVQWPVFESMFALSFGTWIIWRERLIGQRTAEQIVGREPRSRVS
jgi:hypothetical protein